MEDRNDTAIRVENETLFVALSGKLDTLRAISLDEELNAVSTDGIKDIAFDFEGLTYIASAGLRILYWAKELADNLGGRLTIDHISDEVADVFETTGFNDVLSID